MNKDKQREHIRKYKTKQGIKTVIVNKNNKKDNNKIKLGLTALGLGGVGLGLYLNRNKLKNIFKKVDNLDVKAPKTTNINNNVKIPKAEPKIETKKVSNYIDEEIPDSWLESYTQKVKNTNLPDNVFKPIKESPSAKSKLELDNHITKTKSVFIKPKSKPKNKNNIVESKINQTRKASNEALDTQLDRIIPVDSKIIDKFNEYIRPKYVPKSAIPKIDLVEYNPKRAGIKSNKRLDRDLFRDEFEKLPTEMQVATKLNMLKYFAPESYNSKSTLTEATLEMYDNLYNKGIENNLGYQLSDHNSRVITGVLLRNDGNLSKHLQRRKLLGLDKVQKLTAEIPEKLNNLEKATDDELKYISEGLKEFTNDLDNAAKEIEKRTKGQKYNLASEDDWAKYLGHTVIKGNVTAEYALSKRKALGIVSPEMEEVLRQVAVTKGNQGFLQRLLDDLDEHGNKQLSRRDLGTVFKRRLQHETLRNIRVTVGRVKRGVQNIGKIAISKDRKLAELRRLAKGRINKSINQWTSDDFLIFGNKSKEAQRLWEEYNILNNEFLVERGLNKIMNLFKFDL